MDVAIANAERIVGSVDLPVTVDFEGGYAADPETVAANVARLAATGAVGCNFEDQVVGGEGLYPIEEQARRIRAIRAQVGADFFLNLRTDLFLKADASGHDAGARRSRDRTRPGLCRGGGQRLLYSWAGGPGLVERICGRSLCR